MVIRKCLHSLSFVFLCVLFSVKPSIMVTKVIINSSRLINYQHSNSVRKSILFPKNLVKILSFLFLA